MRGQVLVTVAAALLAGCSTPGRGPGAEPPVFAVLEELEPEGAVLATDLAPLTPGHRVYLVVDEDGVPTGDELLVERTPRGEPGESVEVDMGPEMTLYLHALDDGGVGQSTAVAHDQQALTRFDPPLVNAYAELPPHEPREESVAMRVVDVRNPRHQREAGDAVQTMEYVGDARLLTPLGTLLAQRVEVRFSAKLRLARVEREETIWVVPGLGVVARDDRETLTVFALPAKDERRRIVIRE